MLLLIPLIFLGCCSCCWGCCCIDFTKLFSLPEVDLLWNLATKASKSAITSNASWLISNLSLSQQQLEHPEQLWELLELVLELFRELVVELAPEPSSMSFVLAGFGKVLELPVILRKKCNKLFLISWKKFFSIFLYVVVFSSHRQIIYLLS